MDRKHARLVDDAIGCLDWGMIAKTYGEYEGRKPRGMASVKKELRNICVYIIENGLTQFDEGKFIIRWTFVNDQLGNKLEILYCPTKSCSYTSEIHAELLDAGVSAEEELSALRNILASAVAEENYELASIIRDRIRGMCDI